MTKIKDIVIAVVQIDPKVLAQLRSHCEEHGLKIQRWMGKIIEDNWSKRIIQVGTTDNSGRGATGMGIGDKK